MLKSTYKIYILNVGFDIFTTMNKVFNGYLSTQKLYQKGLSDRDIAAYCQNGKLIKLKQGLYRKANMFLNNQQFIDITQSVPYCVISKISALSFYELTTFIPQYTEVDIPLEYKRPKIYYPTVKINNADLYKFRKNIITVRQGRYKFRIYDMEKTLSDCFRRRNSIGSDIVREALQSYFKRSDKNIDKLFKIAKKCRINLHLFTYWAEGML